MYEKNIDRGKKRTEESIKNTIRILVKWGFTSRQIGKIMRDEK